jgi:hypothetical protein
MSDPTTTPTNEQQDAHSAATASGQNRSETATVLAKREGEVEVRSALASVLCNAANYPAEVGAHILGRDLSRLVDAATAAALAARPAPVVSGEVEWGVRCNDAEGDVIEADDRKDAERIKAFYDAGMDHGHTLVRRTVTDWMPAEEGIERAGGEE